MSWCKISSIARRKTKRDCGNYQNGDSNQSSMGSIHTQPLLEDIHAP